MTETVSGSGGARRRHPASAMKFFEITLAFAIMVALYAGVVWAINTWRNTRCPAETFLSGSPMIATGITMLFPLIAVVGAGFLLANLITGFSATTRKAFDGDAEVRRSRQARRSQAGLVRISVVLFVIGVGASVISSFGQFCVTPYEIQTRSAFWKPMRSYPWAAVSTVTTSCDWAGGKRGWRTGYKLGFSDGTALEILGDTAAPTWMHWSQIDAALDPIPFQFDASKVDPRCGVPYADVLARRP